jgi:hypothetical protein
MAIEISQIDQESTQQQPSEDISLHETLPKEKQEDFIAHANINVPQKQGKASCCVKYRQK